MAKTQGQIYVMEFADDNTFYIGQTADSSVTNQYNRASGHAAAACGVNVYSHEGAIAKGNMWRIGSETTAASLSEEDKKIRDCGFQKLIYHTYDDVSNQFGGIYQMLESEGFTTNNLRRSDRKNILDVAEISTIYYYQNAGRKILNKDQGGKAAFFYQPVYSQWGQKLVQSTRVVSTKGGLSSFIGTKENRFQLGHQVIDGDADSAMSQLIHLSRPNAQMEDNIEQFIRLLIDEYAQQQITKAIALAFAHGGSDDSLDLQAIEAVVNANIEALDIQNIINNNSIMLSCSNSPYIRVSFKTQQDSLIKRLTRHYSKKNTFKTRKDFTDDLKKYLVSKRVFDYRMTYDFSNCDFKWTGNALERVVNAAVSQSTTNTNSVAVQEALVYGVCFAICFYIAHYPRQVRGAVLNIDGEPVAVRVPKGDDYGTWLRNTLKGKIPNWLARENTWAEYYSAAMALYHNERGEVFIQGQNQTPEDKQRSGVFTRNYKKSGGNSRNANYYYFSNMDIRNIGNFDNSGEFHQTKAIADASTYGGNYYFFTRKKDSVFIEFRHRAHLGSRYISMVYQTLYNLS